MSVRSRLTFSLVHACCQVIYMFRFIIVGLPGLALAGCAAGAPLGLPEVISYPSPAEPDTAVSVRYQGVVGGYNERMPVSPDGWRGTGVEILPLEGAGVPASESSGESQ